MDDLLNGLAARHDPIMRPRAFLHDHGEDPAFMAVFAHPDVTMPVAADDQPAVMVAHGANMAPLLPMAAWPLPAPDGAPGLDTPATAAPGGPRISAAMRSAPQDRAAASALFPDAGVIDMPSVESAPIARLPSTTLAATPARPVAMTVVAEPMTTPPGAGVPPRIDATGDQVPPLPVPPLPDLPKPALSAGAALPAPSLWFVEPQPPVMAPPHCDAPLTEAIDAAKRAVMVHSLQAGDPPPPAPIAGPIALKSANPTVTPAPTEAELPAWPVASERPAALGPRDENPPVQRAPVTDLVPPMAAPVLTLAGPAAQAGPRLPPPFPLPAADGRLTPPPPAGAMVTVAPIAADPAPIAPQPVAPAIAVAPVIPASPRAEIAAPMALVPDDTLPPAVPATPAPPAARPAAPAAQTNQNQSQSHGHGQVVVAPAAVPAVPIVPEPSRPGDLATLPDLAALPAFAPPPSGKKAPLHLPMVFGPAPIARTEPGDLGLGLAVGPADASGRQFAPHRSDPVLLPQSAAQQIVTTVAQLHLAPEGPVEIALDPPELGRVRLSLVEINGAMTLSITAERPETADLMRRHLSLLTEEFARQGLDAPMVDISGGGQGGRQARDDDRPAQSTLPHHPIDTPAMTMRTGPAAGAATGLDLRL